MDKKLLKKSVFVCIVLILVLGIVYSGLRILESTVFSHQEAELPTRSKTIVRDGVKYFPRQDITVILLMGINQKGPVRASEEPNYGMAADMVALLILDEEQKSCTVLNINRDTMVQMPMLNDRGLEDGTWYGQLGYSHTYGTGVEDSCENTRKTVSALFGGITIDYYISMNVDAVPILNDAVGGVTVTVTEDFSQVDPTIPLGTVTLQGEQALTYVQTRWYVGDDLNLSRIERQKDYMDAFAGAFSEKTAAGENFVLSTYEKVAPYILSDLPISILSGMVERCRDYAFETASLEGENVLGEVYYEFYPDAEKLEALTLELFYAPK